MNHDACADGRMVRHALTMMPVIDDVMMLDDDDSGSSLDRERERERERE